MKKFNILKFNLSYHSYHFRLNFNLKKRLITKNYLDTRKFSSRDGSTYSSW